MRKTRTSDLFSGIITLYLKLEIVIYSPVQFSTRHLTLLYDVGCKVNIIDISSVSTLQTSTIEEYGR